MNCTDLLRWSPLHYAARDGHLAVAQLLVQGGADMNLEDESGWSQLHVAAFNGHVPVAELLITHRASLNTQTNRGSTPLHCAASSGRTSMADLLIQKGARLDSLDNMGMTPAEMAEDWGHNEVARLLQAPLMVLTLRATKADEHSCTLSGTAMSGRVVAQIQWPLSKTVAGLSAALRAALEPELLGPPPPKLRLLLPNGELFCESIKGDVDLVTLLELQ